MPFNKESQRKYLDGVIPVRPITCFSSVSYDPENGWNPCIVESTCKWCRLHSIKNNGRCDNCGGPQ